VGRDFSGRLSFFSLGPPDAHVRPSIRHRIQAGLHFRCRWSVPPIHRRPPCPPTVVTPAPPGPPLPRSSRHSTPATAQCPTPAPKPIRGPRLLGGGGGARKEMCGPSTEIHTISGFLWSIESATHATGFPRRSGLVINCGARTSPLTRRPSQFKTPSAIFFPDPHRQVGRSHPISRWRRPRGGPPRPLPHRCRRLPPPPDAPAAPRQHHPWRVRSTSPTLSTLPSVRPAGQIQRSGDVKDLFGEVSGGSGRLFSRTFSVESPPGSALVSGKNCTGKWAPTGGIGL